jgi:arylsulfatase A-like enzyme
MTAETTHAPAYAVFLKRRRALRAELRDHPWSVGAGFALALWLMTLLGRVLMLGFSIENGLLQGLGAAQVLWLPAELGEDLAVCLVNALLVGGILRALPARARWVGVAIGYVLLLLGSLVVIMSVPLHAALQTTLQLTQLMLAGGVLDLAEAGLATVSPLIFLIALAVLLALALSVPFLAERVERAARRIPPLRAASVACVLTGALFALGSAAPEDGAAVLQTSAVFEFAASSLRFYVRSHPAPPDMTKAPHFPSALMYGQAPPVEPIERLVNTAQLPLHKPNVILVVLESASTLHTGLWNGHPEDTPRMSEMSKSGLIFDQYYSPSPVSMKSLFSMSCSSYPHTMPQAETYTNPSIDCMSLGELLKDQGYRSGLFHGGHFSYTRKDAFFKPRRYDVLRDASNLVHRRKYGKVPWGADDRAVIDDALAWLETSDAKQPFFLHLIFLAPHEPYAVQDAPEPFGTKTNVDRYRNTTLFIDSQIGRVWDWAKQHNVLDDTLFVVVGDHGESFGEHRGDFMHGGRIYETAVNTPMMLVNPRLFTGQRSQRIGNHVDLLPTVLDVLGIAKPDRHQGASLLRGYQPHLLYFYANWQRHYLGLRDGQWKYIYNLDRETHELYDLTHDRAEKHNLALGHVNQVEGYVTRLLNFESFYRELIPNYEHYVDGRDACGDEDECRLDQLKPIYQHGAFRRDRSGNGFRLQLGKQTYDHGLGVAPLSILRYNIRDDGYKRFKGGVGHHAQGGNVNLSLKVSTEIYLDDRLIWSSGKLTADEPAKTFDLDITNGGLLELIGYDVDAEDWRDYIDWVDVRLTR